MKKLIILFLTLLAVTTYGQNTDTQNTTQFNVIRNETATGGNTKGRIADAYEALNHSKVSRMEALVTTGTNDYLIAADAAIVSYSNGGKTLQLLVRFVNANTGAVRVNINSIALVALVKGNGSAFVGGEISPGQMLWIAYTGSVFQVVDIGITNTSATNEIPKSNVTSFVPSGLFSSTLGNLDLGTGLSGTDRTIAATGSATDVGIKINPKGAAGVHLQNDLFQFGSVAGSATLLVNGTGDFTVFGPDGPSSNGHSIYLKAGDGGTGGGNFNGGSTYLSGGLGSGTGVTGNVGFGTSVGSFGGGSKVVFVANAAVNPSTNPSGGFILYGDAGNASHPTIKLPSGTTIDLSLGGITNTAANNEIPKSNAINIIPSGIFSSTLGDITFGTGLSGSTRTITADGSAADVSLSYAAKGQGGHSFSSGSSGGVGFSYGSSYSISLIGAATSIFRTSKLSGAGSFFISASNGVSGGTAGDDLTLNAGSGYSSGVTNGGNVYISPGSKNSTGLNGNIGLFTSSSGTFGAGEKVLFWADATTNPTTNPTSGGIMFVKSSDHSPYWRTPAGVETSMLGGSGGTVSTVSVVSANGLAGTVANPTTTPAITLSTTVNGLVKGNGTAFSAASAGTDYQAPITLTTTGTSGAATFIANTLNIPQYGGGNPFADNAALVKNSSDATKLLILSAASITTGTTRTWTFPDVSGTVARNDAAQNFSGVQTFLSSAIGLTKAPKDSSTFFATDAYVDKAVYAAGINPGSGLTLVGTTLNSGGTLSQDLNFNGAFNVGFGNTVAISSFKINNKAISLGGNFTTSGAFTTTLTVTANTAITLPTTGTIINTNVSTTSAGYAPIAPNDATKYLDGTGVYSVPAGSGAAWQLGSGGTATGVNTNTFNSANQFIQTGTWTASVLADNMATYGGTITAASGLGATGYTWSPSFTGVGTSPVQIAALINPTFSGGTTPINIPMQIKVSSGNGGLLVGNQSAYLDSPTNPPIILARLDQNNMTLVRTINSTTGASGSAGFAASTTNTATTNLLMLAYSSGVSTGGIVGASLAVLRSDLANGMQVGTTNNAQLSLWSNNAKRVTISGAGNISLSGASYFGSNSTTASSLVQIAAGTTAANTAPLQFTSGPLETTIRAGLYEYNNAHYLSSNALNRYAPGGSIIDFTADVGNSGSAETDLFTYTTKASTLSATGEKLTFTVTGSIIGSATASRTINLYFAGTNIGTVAAATISTTGNFRATVEVIRTGSTTARTSTSISVDNLTLSTPITETDLTGLTFTNTNIIKITGTSSGTGSATNDVVAKLGWVNWFPAANN